jgi:hypothetical protein
LQKRHVKVDHLDRNRIEVAVARIDDGPLHPGLHQRGAVGKAGAEGDPVCRDRDAVPLHHAMAGGQHQVGGDQRAGAEAAVLDIHPTHGLEARAGPRA